MVGNRGKGSGSKPKGLASGPAGVEPLDISFDEYADGPSDREAGENNISGRNEIPLEEEQKDEIVSGSVVSDGLEDKSQNVHEVGDGEKDIVTEIIVYRTEGVCLQGAIEDVKALSDGGDGVANTSVMNNEGRINEKKPEEDEALMTFGRDDKDANPGDEKKSSEVTTECVATNVGLASSDHEMMENIVDNLENHEEPSKIDVEEPLGNVSGRDEEHIEGNASITNEVKEASEKVNRPKRKVVKIKVVKKMVRRRPPVVNEETPQPCDENHASGEVCKVDTNEHINNEDKVSDVKDTSDEACKADKKEHVNDEEKAEVKPSLNVNKRRNRIRKKKAPQGQSVTVTAKDAQKPQSSGEVCKVDTNGQVTNADKVSDVKDALDEACEADKREHVNDEEKVEVKPSRNVNKKRNRIRKKKAPQGQSGISTAKDAQKPQSGKDASGSKEHIENNEPGVKIEEVGISGNNVSQLKRSKNKKMANKSSQEVVRKDLNKPKPSMEGKSTKKIDSMGMIFMCSSETKKDCYRYQVLGLPASKKGLVLKIYKGMRLFLFDVDLRMMYGIYKAAGPGGYNIEPRAFKSQFPSQVRFAVLEDCVPLAEERFKKVLKENYYTKNKFNCQLNSEQVKNLCKLFRKTSKKVESKKVSSSQKEATRSSSARQNRKRKRVEDSRRGAAVPLEQERSRRRAQEEARHVPLVIDNRHHGRPVYEREAYLTSVAPAPLYQPLTALSPPRTRTYSFDRAAGVDPYRRDTLGVDTYRRDTSGIATYRMDTSGIDTYRRDTSVVDPYRRDTAGVDPYRRDSVLDHRDLGPSSSRDSRVPTDRGHHDPYVSYRESRAYDGLVYSTNSRREHYDYSTGIRREHYDYTSDGRYVEHYRPAEYRPALPLYRRY